MDTSLKSSLWSWPLNFQTHGFGHVWTWQYNSRLNLAHTRLQYHRLSTYLAPFDVVTVTNTLLRWPFDVVTGTNTHLRWLTRHLIISQPKVIAHEERPALDEELFICLAMTRKRTPYQLYRKRLTKLWIKLSWIIQPVTMNEQLKTAVTSVIANASEFVCSLHLSVCDPVQVHVSPKCLLPNQNGSLLLVFMNLLCVLKSQSLYYQKRQKIPGCFFFFKNVGDNPQISTRITSRILGYLNVSLSFVSTNNWIHNVL